MSEKNMALLSQSEIDTLISFLNQQKDINKFDGEILSQDSINKLIQIIKSSQLLEKKQPLNLGISDNDSNEILAFIGISDADAYSLSFTYSEEKGVVISAVNQKNEEEYVITPGTLTKSTEPSYPWGSCMAPTTFDYIAKMLDLNYSTETFEKVKKHFSKMMYGIEEIEIPYFYLP